MTQRNPAPARLEVCTRPLAALHLDPKNPRTHGKRQIRQIAKSIQSAALRGAKRGSAARGHVTKLLKQSLSVH